MNDVTYETQGQVAVAKLNRPDKFNCISSGLLSALSDCLDKAEADPDIRVLLLCAEGQHFCTGADLDEVEAASESDATLATYMDKGHDVMLRLEASAMPVVAAINGYCLAGGLELAMCADVAFVADNARLGCQHAQYGLVPGWGGTQRLPRLVGLRRALDLMFSARWLEPAEAVDWGLANRVVPADALLEEALSYAQTIARGNPEGLAAMKRLAREGAMLSVADSLKFEQKEAVPVLRSDNVAEGLSAFQERRKPNFK